MAVSLPLAPALSTAVLGSQYLTLYQV